MSFQVNRKAILIASPGGDYTEHLPGVKADIRAFRHYLGSVRGGLWRCDEIITLNNPTAERVLAITQMTCADYLFIYFSGHGSTDRHSGQRLLTCTNRISVSDEALLQGPSPRILLVNDACRTFTGDRIGSIPFPDDEYFSFTGDSKEIRLLFDEYILGSPAGRKIIHATRSGEVAGENSFGGHFTQGLLHLGARMTVTENYQMVGIEDVLYHVPSYLRSKGNFQVPEVIDYSGNLQVPFSVALPLTRERALYPPHSAAAATASNSGTTLLVGLGLLALAYYLNEN